LGKDFLGLGFDGLSELCELFGCECGGEVEERGFVGAGECVEGVFCGDWEAGVGGVLVEGVGCAV